MFSSNSPFAGKLDTNYVPSDLEMGQLRALLVEPTHELARLDTQIDELEIVIEQLKVKRAGLESAIDAHKALMSPVRRIPQDVLGEIFFACIPTAHNALIDPAEAPMLLGRICKHWRSVAYSTPTLWRSLHIPSLARDWHWDQPMVLVSHKLETKLDEFVGAWLERSAAPLSISFSRVSVHPSDSCDTIDHLIGVSHRIRHLRLNSSISDVSPLLLLPPADLPCLESIGIKCSSEAEHSASFWHGVSLFHAPNLHRVSFQGSADALKLPLPWSQLIDLNLECFVESDGQNNWQGGLDLNGAQEVLRRCPHLVRCCLRTTMIAPFVGGPRISLPRLTTLILYQDVDAVQFMERLELPCLRYLGIGGNSRPSSRAVEGSVHRLTLELLAGCRFGNNTLLSLLNILPAVSRLQAPHFAFNEATFDSLRPTPTGTLCPALTHLELGNCFFSDIALVTCIRERLTTDHPLQSIEARFNRAMELDIVHELHAPISEGLHLDLQYFDPSPPPWSLDARQGMFDVLWDM
ncbi:hypothetical protein FB451DRAFT_1302533 [Mycena latifolia]|nr:hypothetical protein FB451DRAFT_1302533 [Mycena latifolia]